MILFLNIVAWGVLVLFALAYAAIGYIKYCTPTGFLYDWTPKAWLWPGALLSVAWLLSRLFA